MFEELRDLLITEKNRLRSEKLSITEIGAITAIITNLQIPTSRSYFKTIREILTIGTDVFLF